MKGKYLHFKLLLLTLVTIFVLSFSSKSYSQCTNCGSQYPSSTIAVTTSTTFVNAGGSTCWYGGEYAVFNVTIGETYEWTTCGDTDFDTELTLYSANKCSPAAQALAYNDDDCGLQSTITWTATETPVRVLVSQVGCTSQSTCMTLQWRCASCGANDECADAIPLTVNSSCVPTTGDVSLSTGSIWAACSGTATDDVWYSFVATGTANEITVDPSSSFDAVFEVISGNCASPVRIKCQDGSASTGGLENAIVTGLTPGETYWIRVYDYYSAFPSTTTFDVCVEDFTPGVPTTGDCLGAIKVCEDTYSYSSSVTGIGNIADLGVVSGCGTYEKNTTWYTFTVESDGIFMFTMNSTDDYDWALYDISGTTSCEDIADGSISSVRCNFSATTGNTGMSAAGTNTDETATGIVWCSPMAVTAGQTFALLVDNYTAGGTAGYDLDFGTGTAGIFDNDPPYLQEITSAPACGESTITFNFNEVVLASTVEVGDFTVTQGANTYTITNVVGVNGTTNDATYTITLNTPLTQGGTYSLNLVDQVTDACNNDVVGNSLTFDVTGVSINLVSLSDASCFGDNDGSIQVAGTGGTAPYSYTWNTSPVQSTATASNLVAGDYTVTVTDNVGTCNATATYTVDEPTAITGTAALTHVLCRGNSTGAINLTPSGGSGVYSGYLWTGGATTQDISGLAAGTYTVTITDNSGCTGTASFTINQPATAVTASVSTLDDVSCAGADDGSITVTASGGTGALTYDWSPNGYTGDGTATYSGLDGNTFSVIVADANSCSVTINNIVVDEPSAITATVTPSNATCDGDNDGAITTSGVSGGTGAYTYTWSTIGGSGIVAGASSQSALTAGTYNLTISDVNSCTYTNLGIAISDPAAITFTVTPSDATCGASNGSATISGVAGGNGVYTYAWSSGGSAISESGLAANTYNVTVYDGNLCFASQSFTVGSSDGPSVTTTLVSDATCYGYSDGSATANVTGGTGTIDYLWSNGELTQTAIALPAGVAYVTVTDDNSCSSSASIFINQPGEMVIATSGSELDCNGDSDGTATVSVTGGTTPYTYDWTGSPTGDGSATITGLSAGTYSVTVTDVNGCTAQLVPPAITSCFEITDILVNSCGGLQEGLQEMVTLQVGASDVNTSTLVIDWPNNPWQGVCTDPTFVANTNATITGGGALIEPVGGLIPAGSEVLVITSTDLDISAVDFSTLDHNVYVVFQCAGNTTGHFGNSSSDPLAARELDISFGGSCADTVTYYPYYLNNVDGESVSFSHDGGWATYNNGCMAPLASTTTAEVIEPTAITATTNGVDVTCYNGTDGEVSVTPSGGTTPYTYLWDDDLFQTTATATGLTEGTYNVTVTDDNGCEAYFSETISEPAQIVISTSSSDATCGNTNGSASVTSGPYVSYDWSPNGYTGDGTATYSGLPAGTYTVTISDGTCTEQTSVTVNDGGAGTASIISFTNETCNELNNGSATVEITGPVTPPFDYLWSNGDFTNGSASTTNSTTTGLSAGAFSVTVTYGTCNATASGTITQPNVLVATITSTTDALCNGDSNGEATVSISGGTTAYTIAWPLGNASNTVTNLAAGTTVVTVTDANACQDTATAVIGEPDLLVATATGTDVLCNGGNTGTGSVSVIGGTTPYSYSWSSGATTASATGLNATVGTYTVTVTDANGCQANDNIVINQPAALSTTATATDASAFGVCDGTATVNIPTGGISPYTYQWGPSTGSQTTTTATALCDGFYTVTVTDSNGCTTTASATVNEPSSLIASTTTTQPLCNTSDEGTATVNYSGGVSPYNITWSNGDVTMATALLSNTTTTGLTAGTYNVTVEDANGITIITSATVSAPSAISGYVTPTAATCYGSTNGSAVVAGLSGGTPGYSYAWSSSINTIATESNLAAGSYDVTVSDANSCELVLPFTINQPTELVASISSHSDVSCNGAADGSAVASFTGGPTTGTTTYTWAPSGGTAPTASGLSGGTYTITIAKGGCSDTAMVVIDEPAILDANIFDTDITCNGAADGIITTTVTGGTSPYTYAWSSGQSTSSLSNLTPNTYTVTVSDVNSCQEILSATITQPVVLNVTNTKTNVSCYGGATGSISNVTVTGGTSPYIYAWSTLDGSGLIPAQANQTGLTAGTYTLTVTDANSCTKIINVIITQPTDLVVSLTDSSSVSCYGANDGMIDITVSGGVSAYTYLWSDGTTVQDLTNAGPDTYSVTVTDANGCQDISINNITLLEPGAITIDTALTNVACRGGNDGEIDVTVIGGTAPLTYTWAGPSAYSNNIEDITGLYAGSYYLTVSDANGCQSIMSAIPIAQPAANLLASIDPVTLDCYGDLASTVNLSVTGGTAPYIYNWNSGAYTTEDLSNVTAGTYAVTVTDAHSCQVNTSITISEPAELTATTNIVDVKCNGASTGSISVTPTGGTSPYSYSGTNGVVNPNLTNQLAGTYSITVTDANSCQYILSETIAEPTAISLDTTIVNSTCNSNNGEATIHALGGVGPYTYLWDGGSTDSTMTGVTSGTYNIQVTDANLCVATMAVDISDEGAPVITLDSKTNVDCNGNANGTINITVTGGASPYAYSWTTGIGTGLNPIAEDQSGLSGGTYSVTVTDANLCNATTSIVIAEPNAIALTVDSTDVDCNGNSTGAVNLTVTGGTTPYTYNWNTGAFTTQDLTNVPAGTYSVIVTDAHSCTETISIDVNEPNVLTAAINTYTGATGAGICDGTATVDVTEGTTPYTYAWTNGQTAASSTGLCAGTHYVTVTDANGCQEIASILITEPSSIILSTVVTNVTCYGASTGAIDLTVIGGVTPYTYNWNSGAYATEDLTNVPAGIYQVTVTDNNGYTAFTSVSITQPTAITASTVVDDVDCNGDATGSIHVNVSGGVTPYTYTGTDGVSNADLTNVVAGTYSITITDANSCTSIVSDIIEEPLNALSVTYTTVNVKCYGMATGSINLTPAGGTPSYTYAWSHGATSQSVNLLIAGSYDVTITDANGCTLVETIVITEPASGLTVSSIDSTDVLCYNGLTGAVDITVIGGTSPFTYEWSNGILTEDLSGVVAGTYTVTVTDALNCEAYASIDVNQPSAALAISIVSQTNTSCGGLTGAATIGVTGGTSPYNYAWSVVEGVNEDLTGVGAGNYFVTVTDANSCTAIKTISITNTDAHTIAISSSENVTCYGYADGNAYVTILTPSANPPYTYEWQDALGNTVSTLDSAVNLSGGTYNVSVTDFVGCVAVESVVIEEPNAFVATTTPINAKCFGESTGRVYLSVTGGSLPYSYLWDNGAITSTITNISAGSYNVVVTDNNGCTANANAIVGEPVSPFVVTETITDVSCYNLANGAINVVVSGENGTYDYNWTNGNTTNSISGLTEGNYSLLISDIKGCDTLLTYTINQPSNLSLVTNSSEVLCAGGNTGEASVSALGGTSPYTFVWDDALAQTTDTLYNASAGTYNVTVTDANSCISTTSVTIAEPDSLLITVLPKLIKCKGDKSGAAYLTASGGKATYTYHWENSSGVTIGSSTDISSLFPGLYYITVTDGNGCTATDNVEITEPATHVDLSYISVNVSCNGGNNGSIDLTAFGGTPGYTYYWNYGQTTEDISILEEGRYVVTVFDANNCMDTITVDITEPNLALNLTSTNIDASCGEDNGSATIIAVGGTSPYYYNWSSGDTTATISNLTPANYVVTVTDTLGCNRTLIITVEDDGSPVLVKTSSSLVSCYGLSDASATVFAAGGVLPYSYVWDNTQTSTTATGLSAGIHSVTVTDGNGCLDTLNVTIVQPDSLKATISLTAALCYGSTDGSASLNVTGGTQPYGYLWSNTETTAQIENLVAGDYIATITDSKGCTTVTDTVKIGEPSGPLAAAFNITNVSCNSGNDGAIDLTTTGGTSPYTYIWGYGPTTEDVSGIFADLYIVTITDANNCTLVDSAVVTHPAPVVRHVTTTPSDCGYSNGSITLDSITGGTAPFTYVWETLETTSVISNLASNDYDLSITDANNCNYVFTIHIGIDGEGTLSITDHQIDCYGYTGSIDAQMINAFAPVTYYWSTNDTIVSNDTLPATYSGLLAGLYSVTVVDSLGCTGTFDNIFIGEAPPQLIANIEGINVSCRAYGNGEAIAHAIGGTQFDVVGANPYNYEWSTGNNTDSVITNLIPNTYYVTISDANDCEIIKSVNITQPAMFLQVALDTNVSVSCYGGNDGLIQVSGFGGTSPYTYKWSNNQKTSLAINLEEGTYQLTITDINGCDTTKTYTITQPDLIEIANTTVATSCQDSRDGSAEVAVVGGVVADDYTYLWNDDNATTTYNVTDLAAGDFYVTVTDDNGCQMIDTITITKTMVECLEIPNCITPNADGINDVFEITNVWLYENSAIEIYNRWGELIFEHSGGYYGNEWDGTYQKNGNPVPMGSYVYILHLNDDYEPKTGVVTVIR